MKIIIYVFLVLICFSCSEEFTEKEDYNLLLESKLNELKNDKNNNVFTVSGISKTPIIQVVADSNTYYVMKKHSEEIEDTNYVPQRIIISIPKVLKEDKDSVYELAKKYFYKDNIHVSSTHLNFIIYIDEDIEKCINFCKEYLKYYSRKNKIEYVIKYQTMENYLKEYNQ